MWSEGFPHLTTDQFTTFTLPILNLWKPWCFSINEQLLCRFIIYECSQRQRAWSLPSSTGGVYCRRKLSLKCSSLGCADPIQTFTNQAWQCKAWWEMILEDEGEFLSLPVNKKASCCFDYSWRKWERRQQVFQTAFNSMLEQKLRHKRSLPTYPSRRKWPTNRVWVYVDSFTHNLTG